METITPHDALMLLFEPSDNIMLADPTCKIYNIYTHLQPLSAATPFFTVNPVKHGATTRSSANVATYRNFIFECDTAPLQQQIEAMHKMHDTGLIRLSTYSGGKSIHHIVSCSDDLNFGAGGSEEATKRYKHMWRRLCSYFEEITGLTFDESTKDPARLTRTPQVMRKDKGVVQKVERIGTLCTLQQLNNLKPLKEPQYIINPVPVHQLSLEEFEMAMRRPSNLYLKNFWEFPQNWADSSGLYPKVRNMALWTIDKTGVDLYTFLAYYDKYTRAGVEAAGYWRDANVAIKAAYTIKENRGEL